MDFDMHEVSTAGNSPVDERAPRHLWYYASLGVIGGAAIILFAVLPGSIAGLALVACALTISIFDRLARRFSTSPIQRGTIDRSPDAFQRERRGRPGGGMSCEDEEDDFFVGPGALSIVLLVAFVLVAAAFIAVAEAARLARGLFKRAPR